jgi:hypothetical protein
MCIRVRAVPEIMFLTVTTPGSFQSPIAKTCSPSVSLSKLVGLYCGFHHQVPSKKFKCQREVKIAGGTASPAECSVQLAAQGADQSHLRRETRKANVLKLRKVEVDVNFA